MSVDATDGPSDREIVGAGPVPTIDSYRRACDAMRDATKWLVAIVPGAGLVLALAALLPDLADLDAGSDAFWVATVLLGVSALGAVLAIWTGARVLGVPVSGWGDVVRRADEELGTGPAPDAHGLDLGDLAPGSLAYNISDDGVLRLYGYHDLAGLLADLLGDEPTTTTVAAGVLAVDYSAFVETRRRFRQFLAVGAGSLLVAFGCLAGATYVIADNAPAPKAAAVTAAQSVVLVPNAEGRDALEEARGCPTGASVPAWAIGGRLDAPELVLATDGACNGARLVWKRTYGVVVPNA